MLVISEVDLEGAPLAAFPSWSPNGLEGTLVSEVWAEIWSVDVDLGGR